MWNYNEFAENIAIVTDDGNTVTYEELLQLNGKFISNFKRKGLTLILCTNSLVCINAYTACMGARIPLMLETSQIPAERMETLIRVYMPDFVFIPADTYCREEWEHIFKDYRLIYGDRGYLLCERIIREDMAFHKDFAILLPVSAEGHKYFRLSYRNILINMLSMIKSMQIRQQDRTITSMEINYSYGLSIVNAYLFSGASIVVTNRKIYTPRFWKLVKRYGVTSFSGISAAYMQKEEIAHKMAYTEEKPDGMDRYINEHGNKRGRIWIVNNEKQEIRELFAEGEIAYEGAKMCMGYAYSRADLKRGVESEGRLYFGNYANLEDEGDFFSFGSRQE